MNAAQCINGRLCAPQGGLRPYKWSLRIKVVAFDAHFPFVLFFIILNVICCDDFIVPNITKT